MRTSETNRRTRTGLDVLVDQDFACCRGARVGVLTHQCGYDASGTHLIEHLAARDNQPALVLSPEHGLWSTHQDMEPVRAKTDPIFQLPVASLYGDSEESLAPASALLAGLDLLLIDLQDVGSRYYTYAATAVKTARAAAGTALRIIVLDRPNPIGGTAVEGGLIKDELRSYVGEIAVPQRHGLTIGELVLHAVRDEGLDVDLTIVPMEGWDRDRYYDELELTWIPPSPNMPSPATALVYPGICLLEGTNVSEGRGTTTPFELFGAPWVNSRQLASAIAREEPCRGFVLIPACFRPQFGKWGMQQCSGLRVHVTDRTAFLPVAFGLAVTKSLCRLYPGQFDWRREAYEFVSDKLAIDLLLGDEAYRLRMEAGESVQALMADMNAASESFRGKRPDMLLY